ncbi:MAG TPA: PfkB family carbohydrate kinase, partial [Candidatus Acidoferrum sp.]|nr:PfkB family carbohydrate kinase [Candidatus Acidoferrum sp.]
NPVYDIIITPAIRTDGRVLSGCSTNACLVAKRLGMPKVGLIGSVGRDFSGRFQLDMNKYGIETSLNAASERTGGFRLVYDNKGDRTLEVLAVAEKITSKSIPEDFLDSNFFLIGPILGEVDFELAKYIRTSTGGTIFLDPQGLVRSIGTDGKIIHKCDRYQFRKIAELVDFVKPNEHESETITGEADPMLALDQLHELGVKVPIVTLADRGSVLLDSGRIFHIPAFQTNAIDPTGAGDTYAGSFIVEYDRTRSIVESALFASAAASIKVEQVGPDFHITQEEARRRKDEISGRLR